MNPYDVYAFSGTLGKGLSVQFRLWHALTLFPEYIAFGTFWGTFGRSDEVSNRNQTIFSTKKRFGVRSRQIHPWMASGDRGDVKNDFL